MVKEAQHPQIPERYLSRRGFLRLSTTAAVAGAALLTPELLLPQKALAAEPFKGGDDVVGTDPRLVSYFAEGYTAKGWDEYLYFLNPSTQTSQLQITYFLNGYNPIIRTLEVPPQRRLTVPVHEWGAGVGRGVAVSAKVESINGVPIVSEREMKFVYNGKIVDTHNSIGAAAPNRTWLFAEGYTGNGFDEYLTIMNPNANNTRLRITYFLDGGLPPVTKEIEVPASSRYTVTVHDAKEGVGRGQAVSAKVETIDGSEIVVERPIYFENYNGQGVNGGHNVVGANAPSTEWLFAEGYTADGFDEYLTIMNPDIQNANLRITYFLEGGEQPVVKQVQVAGQSRFTVAVHDTALGVGRGKAVSAKVESINGVGIVAERPMYFKDFNGQGINGGHNVMGATQLQQKAAFAGGDTRPGHNNFIVAMNPNDKDAKMDVKYFSKDGAPQNKGVIAPARSRTTISLNDASRGGVLGSMEVGSQITVQSDTPMAFERPGYMKEGNDTNVQMINGVGETWISTKNLKVTGRFPFPSYWEVEMFSPNPWVYLQDRVFVNGDSVVLTSNRASSARGEVIIIMQAKTIKDGRPFYYYETKKTKIVD